MIHSLKFTSGYPLTVQCEDTRKYTLKNKVFKFTDGVNILFAPNGHGKSTILNAISIYGLTEGGWSNLNFHALNFGGFGEKTFTLDTLASSKYKFTAEVDMDGPVFKSTMVSEQHIEDYKNTKGFGSGSFSTTEALLHRMSWCERSSGQRNMYEQGDVLVSLINDNKFDIEKFKEPLSRLCNDTWGEMYQSLYKIAESSILKGGKPTLILDEPDLHLDVECALGLFTNVIPKLAKRFQVIVSSHFALLPFFKDFNILKFGFNLDKLKEYINQHIEEGF